MPVILMVCLAVCANDHLSSKSVAIPLRTAWLRKHAGMQSGPCSSTRLALHQVALDCCATAALALPTLPTCSTCPAAVPAGQLRSPAGGLQRLLPVRQRLHPPRRQHQVRAVPEPCQQLREVQAQLLQRVFHLCKRLHAQRGDQRLRQGEPVTATVYRRDACWEPQAGTGMYRVLSPA